MVRYRNACVNRGSDATKPPLVERGRRRKGPQWFVPTHSPCQSSLVETFHSFQTLFNHRSQDVCLLGLFYGSICERT